MRKEFRAIARGRVQLVMYRDFAARNARRLHIAGTVTNLPDGTVEVAAQGEEKNLEEFIKKLRRGSLAARVDAFEVAWREPSGNFEGFNIIY